MATSEYTIETVVLAMLADQAALSGLSMKHHDVDTDAAIDRIVVRCEPREAFLAGFTPMAAPVMWKSALTIEIHVATRTAALIETYATAVDAAMITAPAAAVTAAATLGSLYIDADESGNRQGDGSETYLRVKNYSAIFS